MNIYTMKLFLLFSLATSRWWVNRGIHLLNAEIWTPNDRTPNDPTPKDPTTNDRTPNDIKSKNTEHRMTERRTGPNVENDVIFVH
jgi:hypothetical protein